MDSEQAAGKWWSRSRLGSWMSYADVVRRGRRRRRRQAIAASTSASPALGFAGAHRVLKV